METNCKILETYPDVLSPKDLTKILDVGKNTVYKLLTSNSIQNIKIGKNYKIPKLFLIKYLFNNL